MKTKTCLLLLLALAPALLTACGPRENCAESHDPLDARTKRYTRTLRICTDKKKYDFGEPIHITFTVTNVSDEPLVFDGGDKPAMDIRIWNDRWSDERELTPELTRVTLEPGESRTIEWVWPTPDTDLDAVERGFAGAPETGLVGNPVDGIVIHRPGASPRAVGLTAYYRMP